MKIRKSIFVLVLVFIFLVTACSPSQDSAEEMEVMDNNAIEETNEEETEGDVVEDVTKDTPEEEGLSIKKNITTNSEDVIGDVLQEGVSVNIPKNTFDKEATVILNTIPQNKSAEFKTDGFEFIGSPISVEVADSKSVRLNQPALITIIIPENQLAAIESKDDIFAAYYNKNQWEYFTPDAVDLEKGEVQFITYHFSPFASGKLSKEKQFEHFAQQMAVKSWADSHTEKKFTEATKEYFYELFENKLGITDRQMKGKILRNIVKENDFGDLMVNLEKGDMTSFGTKLGEMTGKVILDQAQLDPGFMSKWVSITSTGSKAAAHALEGDYTQAMKEISLTLMDQHIVGKIFKAGIEATDQAIKDWKKNSINNAFEAYKNGADGEYGYYVDAGDFQAVLNQMKGISHKIYSDAIDKYCLRNNVDENRLDNYTLNKIRAEADKKLEASFKKRLSEESKIEEYKKQHLKLIKYFEDNMLLKKGSLGYDHDSSLESRIERLNIVMENILEQTGMKLNTQLTDSTDTEMSIYDLTTLIGAWYKDKTQTKEEYFAKLKELGFIKEAEQTSKEHYGWVLVDIIDEDSKEFIKEKNKNYKDIYEVEASYGQNNFYINQKYVGDTDTYYDPDKVHGESISFTASFSKPPEVIKAEEEISIEVSLSADVNNSFYTFSGSVRGQIRKNDYGWGDFKNSDEKHHFGTNSKNNYESVSETITATAPEGGIGDTLQLAFHLYSTAKLQTTYVYEWKSLE